KVVEQLVQGVPGAYHKKFWTWELAIAKYRQQYNNGEVEAHILVQQEHETMPLPIEPMQLRSEPTIAKPQQIIDATLDELITLSVSIAGQHDTIMNLGEISENDNALALTAIRSANECLHIVSESLKSLMDIFSVTSPSLST
ncbi:hypothetical protein DXG01_003032, partial [Tephrocybe rancida]